MDGGWHVELGQSMHPEPSVPLFPPSCFLISPGKKRLELEELETFASKENKGAQAFKDYMHLSLLLL